MSSSRSVPINHEENIRETLNDAVRVIAERQTNPHAWLSGLVYLLTRMEEQATNSGTANRASYTDMLATLQEAIRNRAHTGGWN